MAWINFVLGVWLIIVSFISGITASHSASMWNHIIVGILLVIFAYLATKAKKSMCWINVIAGLWIFISAFTGAATSQANYLIVGIIVAIVGLWAALSKPATE